MSLNKYNYSKIYSIYCPTSDDELIYIGSTTKKYICSRFAEHKSDYKRFKEGNMYGKCSSFEIFDKYGVDNCKIKLLEHVNCESRSELALKETMHIQLNQCVNKYMPHSTAEEKKERIIKYYQDNKQKLMDYQKNRYLEQKILKELAILNGIL